MRRCYGCVELHDDEEAFKEDKEGRELVGYDHLWTPFTDDDDYDGERTQPEDSN